MSSGPHRHDVPPNLNEWGVHEHDNHSHLILWILVLIALFDKVS